MLLPPLVLIAVVAVAVLGRNASPQPAQAAAASPAPAALGALAAVASAPAATPSPRSDWPSAVAARKAAKPLAREEGTDGLMGRLPFGLAGDTPIVGVPIIRPEPVNRFTIDDVRTAWSGFDTTPPWVRRLGALGSYATDPFER